MAANGTLLSWLDELPALDVTELEKLSDEAKQPVLLDISKICKRFMIDLGTEWKPQPVHNGLRQRTIDWIQSDIEPAVNHVNKRFLRSTDVGVTYTERVYEGGDFETMVAMVKFVTLAIYLDDLIDKDAKTAAQAEAFLLKAVAGERLEDAYLEQYRNASLNLARCISDPVAGNMLLHSCTTFIEGCVLEYRQNQTPGIFASVKDVRVELDCDLSEYAGAKRGYLIPLPLDGDHDKKLGSLVPHMWPTWLREKSGVCESFAITSFRAPGGVDIPTRLWVAALPEMRAWIMSTNDVLSFGKELLQDDFASYAAVTTKERRQIGMRGTAPDGGWCLRDTFKEIYERNMSTASRINRLLRPKQEARYNHDGSVRSISELVALLEAEGAQNKDDLMKALCMVLWETHQKGYVSFHFQSHRYCHYEIFDWVSMMQGEKPAGPEWLFRHFNCS